MKALHVLQAIPYLDNVNGAYESWPFCSQCGKPAIVSLNDLPVCIDCDYKYQQSQYMQFAQNAAMLNHASREMALIVGMPHLSNEVEIPPAPVPPIHYNNQAVTVSGGTVGAINFGNVHEIQVKLGALAQGGGLGLAEALAGLTNVILNNDQIAETEKNELLERIAFLTDQAAAPPAERKPGMIKTVVSAIKDGSGVVKSVADAWRAVEPVLHGHFGLG